MSTPGSRRGSPKPLARRVQWLVDQFAQGSVRAAAELWGVKRLTLLRLTKGQVRSPRGRVLDQIAEACGTSVDWLRTGKGAPPPPPGPEALVFTPWRIRWQKLVESLELSDAVTSRLVALPGLMNRVFQVFVLEGHPFGMPIRGMEAIQRAEEFEYRAWVALVTGMIEAYGRERVRAKVEAERLWLDLQFNPVAVWRYVQEGVSQRAEDDPIRQAWDEVFRLAGEIVPRLPVAAQSLATGK